MFPPNDGNHSLFTTQNIQKPYISVFLQIFTHSPNIPIRKPFRKKYFFLQKACFLTPIFTILKLESESIY